MTTNLHDKMLAAIDALFSASNEIEAHIAEEQLLDVRAEINKYKLAAESLNEGLRLDDWAKIGCVNHDCDKCKALAEQPAQQELDDGAMATWLESGAPESFRKVSLKDLKIALDYFAAPQAQPRAEGTLAREPLTDERLNEIESKILMEGGSYADVLRAVADEAAHSINTKGKT